MKGQKFKIEVKQNSDVVLVEEGLNKADLADLIVNEMLLSEGHKVTLLQGILAGRYRGARFYVYEPALRCNVDIVITDLP